VTEPAPFAMRDGVVDRDGRRVLDHVDFVCAPGEFVVLLGPNGAGKTTLVSALLGLLPLSSGDVELFGVPVRRFRDWSRVGFVPQRPATNPGVPATLLEVTLLGRLARRGLATKWSRSDVQTAERALATVGLAERAHDPAQNLSGGQQQRLRVARALAGEPEVLVLDEPFSWVDVPTESDLVQALTRFREDGGAIVFVAHDLHAVEAVVDRVVVVRDGRIAAEGPPAEAHIHVAEHRHEHEPPA
jgi:zinc transport system ATP-binding protein